MSVMLINSIITIEFMAQFPAYENLAKRFIRSAGNDDAGPALQPGRHSHPRHCLRRNFAGKISGTDPLGTEKRAHGRKRPRRQGRIPVAPPSLRDLSER